MARYELPDQADVPFPVGGCFGFWGYGLAPFAEPAVRQLKADDRGLPDCDLGFHDSLVVFDHDLGRVWVVASGLDTDGSRHRDRAVRQRDHWLRLLAESPASNSRDRGLADLRLQLDEPLTEESGSREAFVRGVEAVQRYIRRGDVYQVNLSRRIRAPGTLSPARLFDRFRGYSAAPFAMYLEGGDYRLISHSPELFLRMSGQHVVTRPIKGTRVREQVLERDLNARCELNENAKERSELLMITDLMRNDLGRICEFGSVQVPELRRLETHGVVHQAVATVEARLRVGTSHVAALEACFPGGSVTGAPKIRAMEIIDELEAVARGPYTGCGGYLGFNRESQVNILIRTAVATAQAVWFHTGAGIVADSDPEAEFAETVAKAAVFRAVARGATTHRHELLTTEPGLMPSTE